MRGIKCNAVPKPPDVTRAFADNPHIIQRVESNERKGKEGNRQRHPLKSQAIRRSKSFFTHRRAKPNSKDLGANSEQMSDRAEISDTKSDSNFECGLLILDIPMRELGRRHPCLGEACHA